MFTEASTDGHFLHAERKGGTSVRVAAVVVALHRTLISRAIHRLDMGIHMVLESYISILCLGG